MVTFLLSGLEKNKDYFALKKQFFPFGFHTVFNYRSETGEGKLVFKKINDEKKKQLISFFKENNIRYQEEMENNSVANRTQNKNPQIEPKSSIKSPSFYFYKDKGYGKNIDNFIWIDQYNDLLKIEDADDYVQLTTTYPGLLIGSGYNHPVEKNDKDGYQLGFFFDHTTGLPLITGSSIKGVLRSLFENEEKFGYIKEVYKVEEAREKMCKRLFEEGKVIFYDAYIIGTNNEGKIFAADYITSHHSEDPMGAFKDPTPIKFLKILSEVTWQFQFKAETDDVQLFKDIILDFGLGAKTNVGYGQFKE